MRGRTPSSVPRQLALSLSKSEAERGYRSAAGTFRNKSAHRPNHSARPPPRPHPSANKCMDKSFPHPATAPRPANTTHAARSAHTDQPALRNPAPPSRKFPASANPPSSPRRTPDGSAVDLNLRCGKSTPRRAPPPAAPQSKTCAHAPDAAAQSAKAPAVRDKNLHWKPTREMSTEVLLGRPTRGRRKCSFHRRDLQHRSRAHMHEAQFPRRQQRIDRFLYL